MKIRDIWVMLRKEKKLQIELVVSADPTIRNRSLAQFRRNLTKIKYKDNDYKRIQPNATLHTESVQLLPRNGQDIAVITLVLEEIPTVEEI